MMPCPRCASSLSSHKTAGAVHFACAGCGGRMGNLSLLRRTLDPDFANSIWRKVRDAHPMDHHGVLSCPSCKSRMHPAGLAAADGAEVQLDVCRNCQIVWLDAGEMERLPSSTPSANHAKFTPRAAEVLAPLLIERERQRGETNWSDSSLPGGNAPDSPLAALLTYLGFPIEENAPPVRTRPYLTWAVGMLCALTTLGAIFAGVLDQAVADYGFLPADPLRAGGATLITSFFLHGGLLHLIFNLWFLVLAGDNCEDLLGAARYLMLLAVGSMVALATHAAFDPRANVPCVGASGGISGLLTFYALALPRVRLVMCLRLGWYPIWMRMSAATAVVIWISLQIFGMLLQMNGYGSTSNLAHLGGAFAGVGVWLLFRRETAAG